MTTIDNMHHGGLFEKLRVAVLFTSAFNTCQTNTCYVAFENVINESYTKGAVVENNMNNASLFRVLLALTIDDRSSIPPVSC